MKKISKIIVMVLMLALSIGSIFISPVTAVLASTATIGAAITLSKVPTIGKVKQGITIPLGTTESGAKVTVSIVDPYGTEIYKGAGENLPAGWSVNSDKLTFIPNHIGDYKVQYTSSDADTNTAPAYFEMESEIYTITVSGIKPVLVFEDNTKDIIPTKMGYKTGENVNVIVLPTPSVKEYNDETEKEDEIELGLTSDLTTNQKDALANKTMSLSDVASLLGYSVSVKDAKHAAVEVGYVYDEVAGTVKYTVSPVENVFGTYTVTYNYAGSDDVKYSGLATSKKFTFEVQKDFNYETELSFVWEEGKTMPQSAVLGKEVELPKPVVSNEDDEKVNVYTDVNVYFIEKGKTNNFTSWENADSGLTEGWTKLEVKDFTFVANHKAKDGGSYLVKYDMEDYFGNSLTKQYTISNVYDSEKPVVYLVNAYTNVDETKNYPNSENVDIENDIENTIPALVATNKQITLPAIYATDNTISENISESEKELTLTRRYVYNGISYNFKSSSLIASASELKDNEMALFTPNASGTYTFYYEATDKEGNVSRERKFVIKVEDSYNDTIDPVLTVPTVVSSAYTGETITFDAPTAVDYKDAEKTEISEKSLKTTVGFYYVDALGNKVEVAGLTADSNGVYPLEVNEDGSYSLKIENNASIKKAILVFSSKDFGSYSASNSNNVASKEVEVLINDVNGDLSAPTLKTTLNEGTFTQSETKEIQAVEFEDVNNLNIDVKVTYNNGEENVEVPVSMKPVTKEGNVYKLANATFTSYHVGTHIVTITATDANGNSKVVAYPVEVTRSLAPSIDGIKAVPSEVEVGKQITLPTGVVRDYDGTIIENVEIQVVSIGENTPELNGYKFTAKETGVYTFVYKAIVDGNEITSSKKVIEAKDNYKPTITLNNDNWDEDIVETADLEYVEDDLNGSFVIVDSKYVAYDSANSAHASLQRYSYKAIKLPGFTVSDTHIENNIIVAKNEIAEYSIKVLDKNSKVLFESVNGKNKLADNSYEFTPTGNGAYTVVYSATDKAGKLETREFTLQVGDCTPPEIDLNNAQVVASNAKVGAELKINLDVIELEDNIDGKIDVVKALKAENGVKFEIKIVSPTNKTVVLSTSNEEQYSQDDKAFRYTLSEKGEYKITYIVTDSSGLTSSKTEKVIVGGESSSSVIGEGALGTILIVASVALLAGVVVYFAVTNKKYTSDNKKRK